MWQQWQCGSVELWQGAKLAQNRFAPALEGQAGDNTYSLPDWQLLTGIGNLLSELSEWQSFVSTQIANRMCQLLNMQCIAMNNSYHY